MNMTDKSLFMQNDRLSLYAGETHFICEQHHRSRGRSTTSWRCKSGSTFSFYGMRALLILYLTNQLKYDDNHAYALFSAYCSLVYVTPILGGYHNR